MHLGRQRHFHVDDRLYPVVVQIIQRSLGEGHQSNGISSRICKEAVKIGRAEGLKIGLLRPIMLWPFPQKAMEKFNGKIKGYLTVEMNACGQMVEDVALYARGTKVYSDPTGRKVADSEDLVELAKNILSGKVKEAF